MRSNCFVSRDTDITAWVEFLCTLFKLSLESERGKSHHTPSYGERMREVFSFMFQAENVRGERRAAPSLSTGRPTGRPTDRPMLLCLDVSVALSVIVAIFVYWSMDVDENFGAMRCGADLYRLLWSSIFLSVPPSRLSHSLSSLRVSQFLHSEDPASHQASRPVLPFFGALLVE